MHKVDTDFSGLSMFGLNEMRAWKRDAIHKTGSTRVRSYHYVASRASKKRCK